MLERLRNQEAIDFDAVILQHPDQAESLCRILPGLAVLTAKQSLVTDCSDPVHRLIADFDIYQRPIGDFQIIREVGRGGMGIVFEAEQISLGRRVALKILPTAAILDERQFQRFVNEARTAASLHHPGIVPVYAVGCDSGIQHYAMQFIDGQNWAQIIQTCGDKGLSFCDLDGHRSEAEAIRAILRHAIDVANALHYAHQLGIVHRDIKPSNLILDTKGKTWIADFGLARMEDAGQLTQIGEVIGTLRYMSPEQVDSTHAAKDHRVDIYGAGATLFEMLTLRPVFAGSSRTKLLKQILTDEPASPRKLNPKISRELEAVILKALEKNPLERYSTAAELAEDLQCCLDGRAVRARRPNLVDSTKKWCRRNSSLVAAACLTLLTVSIVSTIATVLVVQKNQETVDALTKADRNARDAKFQSARLIMERSLQQCELGEIGQGINGLANALTLGPADESEYRQDIRSNIHAWSQQIHPLELLIDHSTSLVAAEFSNDDQWLLISTDNGELQIRNSTSGTLARTIRTTDRKDVPVAFAIHPQKNLIAMGDSTGELQLIDLDTGQMTGKLQRPLSDDAQPEIIKLVEFSPDGETIFTCNHHGLCRFWSSASNEPIGQPMAPAQTVVDCTFSPDGQTIVTASRDHEFLGQFRVWQVPTGEPQSHLETRGDYPHAVAWQGDGEQLVFAGESFAASIWDLKSTELAPKKYPHLARVRAVAACQKRFLVATGSRDQTVKIWDSSIARAKPFGATLLHPGEVNHVAFDHSGQRLVSIAGNQTRVWRISSPEIIVPPLEDISVNERLTKLNPSGTEVYAQGTDGKIHSWSTVTGQRSNLSVGPAKYFAISRDGTKLVWATVPWATPAEFGAYQISNQQTLWTLPNDKVHFDFTPNGNQLIVSSGPTLKLVDFQTGDVVQSFQSTLSPTIESDFNEYTGLVASGDIQGVVQIWDSKTGQAIGLPIKHDASICDVQFSPSGDELSVGVSNGQIHFWNVSTHHENRPSTRLPMRFKQMSFVAGGNMVLGVSGDATAQFFDSLTAIPIGPPLLNHGAVKDVSYSADGRTLATRGSPSEVRLWRVPTWAPGDAQQIKRKTESITGITTDDRGQMKFLTAQEWKATHDRE